VEVDIAKHRNGPCGSVDLEFIPHLTRFKGISYGVDTN
jgi:replicative DNA helicase